MRAAMWSHKEKKVECPLEHALGREKRTKRQWSNMPTDAVTRCGGSGVGKAHLSTTAANATSMEPDVQSDRQRHDAGSIHS